VEYPEILHDTGAGVVADLAIFVAAEVDNDGNWAVIG
jgi:hypothetical protein